MALYLKTKIIFLTALTLLMAKSTYAEGDLFSERMCEKIQSCSMQKMRDDGAPEEMVEMMRNIFAQQCTSINELYGMATKANGLYGKAKACAQTREAMNCEDLLNNKESPECMGFEEAVNSSAFNDIE